jgi:TorA maturation chaperone TorD
MTSEKPPRGEQELWRANTYKLLARLLTKPPNHQLVAQLGEIPPLHLENGEDAVALAWGKLGEAARRVRMPDLFAEFRALFDHEGGIVIPRASRYVDGELNAKPLNLLRAELTGLAIELSGETMVDHAGSLCASMCLLIESEDPRQIGFFSRHLKPWLPAFFRDLKAAPPANFYRPVGSLGEAFIEVERIFLRETY